MQGRILRAPRPHRPRAAFPRQPTELRDDASSVDADSIAQGVRDRVAHRETFHHWPLEEIKVLLDRVEQPRHGQLLARVPPPHELDCAHAHQRVGIHEQTAHDRPYARAQRRLRPREHEVPRRHLIRRSRTKPALPQQPLERAVVRWQLQLARHTATLTRQCRGLALRAPLCRMLAWRRQSTTPRSGLSSSDGTSRHSTANARPLRVSACPFAAPISQASTFQTPSFHRQISPTSISNAKVPSLASCRLERTRLDGAIGPDIELAQVIQLLWNDVAAFNGARASIPVLQSVDLSGADLRDADLRRVQMFNSNLQNAILSQCKFGEANLVDCDLRAANFSGAKMKLDKLGGSDASGADFSGAMLQNVRLDNAKLVGASFRGATVTGGGLAGCDATHANFEGALFQALNVNKMKAPGARFARATIDAVIFNYGDIRGADFQNATFKNAGFDSVDLTDVDFRGCDVSSVEFTLVENKDKARF